MKNLPSISLVGLLLLTGCGGGGQGPSDGGTGGEPPPAAPEGTARLIVNTQTGAVQVVPLTPSSRAVFAGQAIKIASNLLLDAPGSTGRRVLNVALQNNSGEPVGVGNDGSVSGLKVVFTSFTNLNPGGNLRELTQVSTVAGTGPGFLDGPSSNAKLNGVTGIAIAQDGTTYLADGLNHRIRKISNGYVSTLAGSGTASSVDGYGVNASFNKPYDIALGPDGSLYVSEVTGNKIRRVTADGRVTTVCGTGVAGYTNGAGNVAQFSKPEGIAIGPDGGIYVCDSNNRRLRKIEFLGGDATLSTNYSALTFAGSGVDSSVDGTSNTASFRSPRDVACDPSGNLFVTDRLGSRIRYVTRDGDVVTICGTSVAGSTDGPGNTARCNFPSGITQLNDGTSNTILFTETGNNSLRQATLQPGTSPGVASNWTVRWVACNGTAGYVDGRGDSAMFSAPAGPAYWNGSLYVADGGNSAVRQVSCSQGFPVPYDSGPATSELPSLADADGVTAKQEPYLLYEGSLASGATTAARSWQFIVPSGITLFETIVRIEAETEFITGLGVSYNPSTLGPGSAENLVTTWAGSGGSGYINGSLATAAFSGLSDMVFDGQGNAFVVDAANVAIRRIGIDGVVTTVLGGPGTSSGPANGTGNLVHGNSLARMAVSDDGKFLYFVNIQGIIRCAELTGADPKISSHWTVANIAGAETSAYADGLGSVARFLAPHALALTPEGSLYVTELNGNRIRRMQHSGGSRLVPDNWRVTTVAGSTVSDAGGTDGFGTAARFSSPSALALLRGGDLLVADFSNYRIRRVSPIGNVTTVAGFYPGSLDGQGTSASFAGLFGGIAVDSSDYAYVGDNSRIRRISPSGEVRTVAGYNNGTADGFGNTSVFNYIDGIAMSPAGTLYVITGGTAAGQGGGDRRTIKAIQRVITK